MLSEQGGGIWCGTEVEDNISVVEMVRRICGEGDGLEGWSGDVWELIYV